MGRVIARVLEILQASLDKSKYLNDQLSKKHTTVKNDMLDLLQEKDKIDIQALLETIIFHVQSKHNEEIGRLEKIIEIMIHGDFTAVNNVYFSPTKIESRHPSPEKKEIARKSLEKSREKI